MPPAQAAGGAALPVPATPLVALAPGDHADIAGGTAADDAGGGRRRSSSSHSSSSSSSSSESSLAVAVAETAEPDMADEVDPVPIEDRVDGCMRGAASDDQRKVYMWTFSHTERPNRMRPNEFSRQSFARMMLDTNARPSHRPGPGPSSPHDHRRPRVS